MNELYLAAPVAITGLVGWLRFRPRKPVVPVAESSPEPVRLDDMTQVDFHIERFERAIEQGTNPVKMIELRRNLAYWQALKAAVAIRSEG